MQDYYCDRCGAYLPEGSRRYTVNVQIVSDCDGFILFGGDTFTEEPQRIFNEIENSDDKELEEDMYQEASFILCLNCKKRFARDPLNSDAVLFKTNKNSERLFH